MKESSQKKKTYWYGYLLIVFTNNVESPNPSNPFIFPTWMATPTYVMGRSGRMKARQLGVGHPK